jgi:hypothetical protein
MVTAFQALHASVAAAVCLDDSEAGRLQSRRRRTGAVGLCLVLRMLHVAAALDSCCCCMGGHRRASREHVFCTFGVVGQAADRHLFMCTTMAAAADQQVHLWLVV